MKLSCQYHDKQPYSQERVNGTYWLGHWVGPESAWTGRERKIISFYNARNWITVIESETSGSTKAAYNQVWHADRNMSVTN